MIITKLQFGEIPSPSKALTLYKVNGARLKSAAKEHEKCSATLPMGGLSHLDPETVYIDLPGKKAILYENGSQFGTIRILEVPAGDNLQALFKEIYKNLEKI